MIHYIYNRQVKPPAPFVHVTVRCDETGEEIADLPAQLDSAADRSVLPAHVIKTLRLVPLDELPVAGFGGQVLLVQTYKVQLRIRNLASMMVEVLGHSEEPFVLLGRDVLNSHRVLLDGPRLTVEID